MKKNIFFYILGIISAAIFAYIFAEKLVTEKIKLNEKAVNRAKEKNKVMVGIYKDQGNLFINPRQWPYIPDDQIIYQTPSKTEILDSKPGKDSDKIYDEFFYKYVLPWNLKNPQAWKIFQEEYPKALPNRNYPDYNLRYAAMRKSFYSAMDRRRNSLKK